MRLSLLYHGGVLIISVDCIVMKRHSISGAGRLSTLILMVVYGVSA